MCVSRLTSVVFGSLQARIIAIVLGCVLVTALSATIFAVQARANIAADAAASQAAVAQTYVGVVDEYLSGARSATEAVTKLDGMRTPLQLDAIKSVPDLNGVPEDVDAARRLALRATVSSFARVRHIIVAALT